MTNKNKYQWCPERPDSTVAMSSPSSLDKVGSLNDVDHNFKRGADWKEKFDKNYIKAAKRLNIPHNGWTDKDGRMCFDFRSTRLLEELPHPDECLYDKPQPSIDAIIAGEPHSIIREVRSSIISPFSREFDQLSAA